MSNTAEFNKLLPENVARKYDALRKPGKVILRPIYEDTERKKLKHPRQTIDMTNMSMDQANLLYETHKDVYLKQKKDSSSSKS